MTGTQRKTGVIIVFADEVNFKPRLIKRDKDGHYIISKGKPQKE